MQFRAVLGRIAGIGMLFTLAGCGGDGGVNSTSGGSTTPLAPAPSAVTPSGLSASTSFSNTMQSGNFVTLRAAATVDRPASNSGTASPTVQIAAADANNFISYNAATNVYTLNYTGSSGTQSKVDFTPTGARPTITANGSPDPTEVNFSYNDCYTSGCYSSNYIISHKANNFTYTYTAFGSNSSSSLSMVDSSSSASTSFFVFGFPTPTAAVPRSGSATYTLDLVGTYPGTGTGSVNFAAGTYNFSGNIAQSTAYAQTTGSFQSTGTLATTNGFSGTINLTVNQTIINPSSTANTVNNYTFKGSIGGLFFGPSAQELGGTFVAPNTSTQSNVSGTPVASPAYGAILGHR